MSVYVYLCIYIQSLQLVIICPEEPRKDSLVCLAQQGTPYDPTEGETHWESQSHSTGVERNRGLALFVQTLGSSCRTWMTRMSKRQALTERPWAALAAAVQTLGISGPVGCAETWA